MACKQPTSQQLAYLDELKQRLQELRKRQETFMQETAEILRNISSDRSGLSATDPETGSIEAVQDADGQEEEGVSKIKHLIQRFEDLRQTSRQFSDQPTPEELLGVDVRKLLKGYERLIVEGNILQKSWLLLKKTTESCARLSNRDEPMLNKTSSITSSFAEHTYGNNSRVFPSDIESSLSIQYSSFSTESISQHADNSDPKDLKRAYGKRNRQRFGALLQLAIRLNPFCSRSVRKNKAT